MILSSSKGGALRMGSTPPISHTSGSGVYMSGSGQVLFGDAAGPRLQYDGTNVIMSSSKFYLGSTAQFVSGSNGNIEISSSNFHLDSKAGSMRLSGSIFASDGTIGGWSIGSSAIESNTSDFRGVKIVSGSGVSGYGSSAHSKDTSFGQFSFGVAAAPGGGGCFLAGTLIQMLTGTKRIEDVIVGDVVKSFDLKTNSIKDSKVLWLSVHDDFDYMIINGIIKVTSNHPFYSDGNWIEAGDLSIGDKILHVDGLEHTIKTIELSDEQVTVYNFEVEGYHNYFAEGYLVHNAEKDETPQFTP